MAWWNDIISQGESNEKALFSWNSFVGETKWHLHGVSTRAYMRETWQIGTGYGTKGSLLYSWAVTLVTGLLVIVSYGCKSTSPIGPSYMIFYYVPQCLIMTTTENNTAIMAFKINPGTLKIHYAYSTHNIICQSSHNALLCITWRKMAD